MNDTGKADNRVVLCFLPPLLAHFICVGKHFPGQYVWDHGSRVNEQRRNHKAILAQRGRAHLEQDSEYA
jgi:hypothetical protein